MMGEAWESESLWIFRRATLRGRPGPARLLSAVSSAALHTRLVCLGQRNDQQDPGTPCIHSLIHSFTDICSKQGFTGRHWGGEAGPHTL